MKFQCGIFDTDLYRKEYPDKIDSWLTELKTEQYVLREGIKWQKLKF